MPTAAAFPSKPSLNGCRDQINTLIEELQAVGVELKDFDKMLLDFPAIHEGREIYLCWHRGETAVQAWHEVGRRVLPAARTSCAPREGRDSSLSSPPELGALNVTPTSSAMASPGRPLSHGARCRSGWTAAGPDDIILSSGWKDVLLWWLDTCSRNSGSVAPAPASATQPAQAQLMMPPPLFHADIL